LKSNSSPAADGAADAPTGERLLSHNARFGLVLFFIYLLIYAGFVVISSFFPDLMAHKVEAAGGVNVAIVYGMVLIITAFVLAMVYMIGCKPENEPEVTQ
jgi:uncharacterized membrane protein (DUF485 family)